MDPLIRFKDAHLKGLISDDVYDLVLKRFPIMVGGVNRIEKASGIQYPMAYVEPSVVVSSHGPNSYEFGILFARTIPVPTENAVSPILQELTPLCLSVLMCIIWDHRKVEGYT